MLVHTPRFLRTSQNLTAVCQVYLDAITPLPTFHIGVLYSECCDQSNYELWLFVLGSLHVYRALHQNYECSTRRQKQ